MKAERWQQVDKLFQAALSLDSSDRGSFLDHACKGDAATAVPPDMFGRGKNP
jgi:hypothetical protein